jgi:hypothetical protein
MTDDFVLPSLRCGAGPAASRDATAVASFTLPDLGVVTVQPGAANTSPAAGLAEPVPADIPRPRKQRRATPGYYKPGELAARWGVTIDKVLLFIRTGELRAFNVATKTSRRPRYRITDEAVSEFETARAACPGGPKPPPTPKSRRRTKPPARRTYF